MQIVLITVSIWSSLSVQLLLPQIKRETQPLVNDVDQLSTTNKVKWRLTQTKWQMRAVV